MLTIVVLFFWIVLLGDKGVYHLRKLSDMKTKLTKERTSLGHEIDKLSEERRNLLEATKLEPVIRKELGYIRPGEIVFEEKRENQ